ncbi:MAG: TonB-dependent receptor [Acidobacteriota bacterium]
MTRIKPIYSLMVAGALLVALGPEVYAASEEAAPSAATEPTATAGDGGDAEAALPSEDEAVYEEIVVTGGLIEDSLQDTPESVAVWNSDTMTDAGLGELQDVFNQTANAYQVGNGEGFGIRGINHSSVGTGGIGELGSYYVDGVALTGLAKRIGPSQLWDVEQVEILRGPQTTNVGRNALAGAVVLTTKEPVFQNESRWRFGLAEDATWDAAGMVNTPLGESSALRITAESWNSDGFINNPTRGEDDFDAREYLTFRAKYLYQPQGTSDFDLLVTAQYGETRRGDDIVDLALGEDRINSSNIDTFVDNDSLLLSAEMRWNLNDRWRLRTISSVLESDTLQTVDDDQGPGGGNGFSTRDSVDDNWAQDVRFEYSGESSRGVFGLFYTEVDIAGRTFGEANVSVEELGVPAFLRPFYPETVRIGLNSPFDILTRNFAAFGHWDWQLADRWRAFVGARWDNENQQVDESVTTIPLSLDELPDTTFLPPPIAAAIEAVNAALLAQAGTTESDTDTDYEAFLPEAGLSYEWSDTVTASLFYKQGYRAGGASVTLVGRLNEYDPETLDLAEFSVRSALLDRRLTLNTNVYAGRWEDQQVSVQQSDNTFDFLVVNAGESEIYGFEVDFSYRPQAAWDLYGSLGFASTEFTDFQSADLGELTGNRFSLAPEWTAALGFNYRFGGGWFVHGDVGYQSEAFSSVDNEDEFIAESRTLLNLRGGYETARYSVLGFIDNATDELYLTSSFRGGPSGRAGRYGNPRQAGVQMVFRF